MSTKLSTIGCYDCWKRWEQKPSQTIYVLPGLPAVLGIWENSLKNNEQTTEANIFNYDALATSILEQRTSPIQKSLPKEQEASKNKIEYASLE